MSGRNHQQKQVQVPYKEVYLSIFIFSAMLRQCFPKHILLGPIYNPLKSSPDCSLQDITDDNSGSIRACLCHSDFCNNDINQEQQCIQRKPSTVKEITLNDIIDNQKQVKTENSKPFVIIRTTATP